MSPMSTLQFTFDTNEKRLSRKCAWSSVLLNDENCFTNSMLERDRQTQANSEATVPASQKHARKISRAKKVHQLLGNLRDLSFSPVDLMLEILNSMNADYASYRTALYSQTPEKVAQLLGLISGNSTGSKLVHDWVRDRSMEVICDAVSAEMDKVKATMLMNTGDMSLHFLVNWSIDGAVGNAANENALILLKILLSAAQTKRAKAENTIKDPEKVWTCGIYHCNTNKFCKVCKVIVAQLANERSQKCMSFQGPFRIFLWSGGASRSIIDCLHHCRLSILHDLILTAIKKLADGCIENGKKLSRGPHGLGHDNINIKTSMFIVDRELLNQVTG
jgi:hypothetical protein